LPQNIEYLPTPTIQPQRVDLRGPKSLSGSAPVVREDGLYSYAIMRTDIVMPPGKLAAQAAHVCAQSLIEFLTRHPDRTPEFQQLGKSGSRIVLGTKRLSHLLQAADAARAAGLPCALFEDSGHILLPDFTGDPVITGLGIGPAPREAMREITKRFRCL